ncbi:MAG: hypothetical protein DRI73_03440 [Bacteroidetes bacterium]|nr:MAG: hypothetical protein DRI73_03440 [Bacteroidota bacterium]
MKKLMHILFLSCLKATELIEKKLHFKLSITEKLQLRMHKSMCDACTMYEKQSIVLEKGLSSLKEDNPDKKELEQLKKIIIQKLESTGT